MDPGRTLNYLAIEIRGVGNGRDSPWRLDHSGNLKTKAKAPLALGSKWTGHRHEATAEPGYGCCRQSSVLGTQKTPEPQARSVTWLRPPKRTVSPFFTKSHVLLTESAAVLQNEIWGPTAEASIVRM